MHIVPKYSYITNFEPYVVYWGPPKWNTEQSWWVSPKVADSHQMLPIYSDVHHRTSPYMDLSTGGYKTRYPSELFDATLSKSRGHRDYKIKNTSHYLLRGLRDAAHSVTSWRTSRFWISFRNAEGAVASDRDRAIKIQDKIMIVFFGEFFVFSPGVYLVPQRWPRDNLQMLLL